MRRPQTLNPRMLAPCGMDCTVCSAHLREKKPCGGCRTSAANKPERCRRCVVKACAEQRARGLCFRCSDFPCGRIKSLDRSYRVRYDASLVENGLAARRSGIRAFLQEDLRRWTCTHCDGVVSLHDRACSDCGRPHPPASGSA
jgi:hypothetical protein